MSSKLGLTRIWVSTQASAEEVVAVVLAMVEDSWVEVEASVMVVEDSMLTVEDSVTVEDPTLTVEDASVVVVATVVKLEGRQTAALAPRAPKAARRATK